MLETVPNVPARPHTGTSAGRPSRPYFIEQSLRGAHEASPVAKMMASTSERTLVPDPFSKSDVPGKQGWCLFLRDQSVGGVSVVRVPSGAISVDLLEPEVPRGVQWVVLRLWDWLCSSAWVFAWKMQYKHKAEKKATTRKTLANGLGPHILGIVRTAWKQR